MKQCCYPSVISVLVVLVVHWLSHTWGVPVMIIAEIKPHVILDLYYINSILHIVNKIKILGVT